MTTLVISQPMFLPWPGLFEQVRLADVYIHLDDVQMPTGRSLTNRVRVKTADGPRWMTAPVRRHARSLINEVLLDDEQPWRQRHLRMLSHALAGAPHRDVALELVETLYVAGDTRLADLNARGIEAAAAELDLAPRFLRASDLGVVAQGSERIEALCAAVGADRYITGHGARNYLDHERLEAAGTEVAYLAYERRPYPQLHGAFDPHVSVIDLLANLGPGGRDQLCSPAVGWREFLRG